MENKPHIIIDLPPHLHDFLFHEFPDGAKEKEAVKLDLSNDIGKYISSMVTIIDKPVKQSEMKNPLPIILPVTESNHYILKHNFIFIPTWKEKMIQDFLESVFRTRVKEYFVAGYEKGFSQDKIINAFLMAYNIKKNKISYDMIKKIDYRNRQKIAKQIDKEIQLSLFE